MALRLPTPFSPHYQTTTFSPQGAAFTPVMAADVQKDVTALGWNDASGNPLTHYNIDEDSRTINDVKSTIDTRLAR